MKLPFLRRPQGAAARVAVSLAALVSAPPCHAADPLPAAVQPPVFNSVFEHYRSYTGEPAPQWQKANQQVEQAGGWKAYLRESRQAVQPDPAGPASTPSKPAAATPPTGPVQVPSPSPGQSHDHSRRQP